MYGIGHRINHVLRLVTLFVQQQFGHIPDTQVAKLCMLIVLGLVQSVGKEENGGLRVDAHLLLCVFVACHNANRQVGLTRQGADVAPHEQRSIVTGIAVTQQTRFQVEHTDKYGDKHICLVAFRHGIVQCSHNLRRNRHVG